MFLVFFLCAVLISITSFLDDVFTNMRCTQMNWVTEELKYADLGDTRRNKRLVKIVEDLADQPNVSVTQAARNDAALQGLYNFWANRRIKLGKIIRASYSQNK